MLTLYTLECANSRLNPESHSLVDGSFLLTDSFCKKYSVTSLWCTLVNPFVEVYPTRILVHPRVQRAHRLKSADLQDNDNYVLSAELASLNTHLKTFVFQMLVYRKSQEPQITMLTCSRWLITSDTDGQLAGSSVLTSLMVPFVAVAETHCMWRM